MNAIKFITEIAELVGNSDTVAAWRTPTPVTIMLEVIFEKNGKRHAFFVEKSCIEFSECRFAMEDFIYKDCMDQIRRYLAIKEEMSNGS